MSAHMRIEAGINGLIQGAEAAVDDTYKWERRTKRSQKVNYAILAFDVIWLAILLTVWSHTTGLAVGVMIAAIALMVFLVYKQKKHLEWIYETRKRWKLESLHWQAAKIEFNETGYLSDWVFRHDT